MDPSVSSIEASPPGSPVRRSGLWIPAVACGGVAVWLLPQRSDEGTRILLAVLVAVAVAMAVWLRRAQVGRSPRRLVRGIATAILVVTTTATTGYIGASTVDVGWFGGGITHGPRNKNLVAITFDDGPNTMTTPAVIRILDAHGVRATFFVVGKALEAEPDIVRAEVAHGNLVGNHSFHHDQWRWLDPRYPELRRTQEAFAAHQLPCPGWYRPPHGQRTPFIARLVSQLHMRMALWDVSARDWATKDPHRIARHVLSKVRPGSIIVLHDGLDGNPAADRTVLIQALPEILDGLAAKGLHPVRLDQLVGGPTIGRCN